MWRTAMVGVGGAFGSIARYWIAGLALPWTPPALPFGTLVVNVAGSFIIGVILAAALERDWLGADLRVALAAGVCGGFTTMSSFSFETLALLEQGRPGMALTYIGATVMLCVVATWLGLTVIRGL
jgi:CrcB protein